MKDVVINEKPILKLSPYALYVLECDSRVFSSVPNEAVKISTLVNRIILKYSVESQIVSNIHSPLTDEALRQLLHTMNIEMTKSHLISYRENAQHCQYKYEFPENFIEKRIALDKEATDMLAQFADNESYVEIQHSYGKGGVFSAAIFVSALLEEYSRLPIYKRETIFYADTIFIVNSALKEIEEGTACYLRVNTEKRHNIMIYPLEIRLDEWSTYNYLIGIGDLGDGKEERPMSIRISKITDIHKEVSQKMLVFHNKRYIEELYTHIRKSGVMFLGNPLEANEKIVIKLTASGFRLYTNMVFMRPEFDSIEELESGDFILTFSCTHQQILNYFRKMGGAAEVISPVILRENFAKFYYEANNIYQN